MPRLQINDKLRVRQYIISDPSNVYYTEYYTSLKETSSADWQQQMKTPPTSHTTLDPMSNRLQNDTSTNVSYLLLMTITHTTRTRTMVSIPIGTLIATINIIYTSTVISTNQITSENQILMKLSEP